MQADIPRLETAVFIFLAAGSMLFAADPSSNATHEQQLAWWQAQRFGMFIHWGPVSQTGQEIGWGRGEGTPPVLPYDTLYKTFNPTGFDADEWVQIARDAGMNYMVLVTKHHDGFCEFNSALTNYKITAPECPFGRDVSKELADACHAAGMGLGFYYSPTDWYTQPLKTGAEYAAYYTSQVVDELLSNYGRVDVIWYDLGGAGADGAALLNRMRQKQPWVLVNNRGDTKYSADFNTPEQMIGPLDTTKPWEACMTIQGGPWAWSPYRGCVSLNTLISQLVDCADGDGNYLLNIGPKGDGTIDSTMVSRLKGIGDFLRLYGETIYGTRGGPILPGPWGGSTHKGNTLYLHYRTPVPFTGTLVIPPVNFNGRHVPLNATIVSCASLTGGTPTFNQDSGCITIRLPAQADPPLYTILKMELDYSTPPPPVPPTHNIALGKTATQSSDFVPASTGTAVPCAASFAVDGDIDPSSWSRGSITHTGFDSCAWWMVDLGSSYPIDIIKIYPRKGIPERFDDFSVIVLDSNHTPVWSSHQTAYPDPFLLLDAGGQTGRYVKIQLTGTNFLSLTEVQVFDTVLSTPEEPARVNAQLQSPIVGIHPNPFSGSIHVSCNLATGSSGAYHIYNLRGQLMFTHELSAKGSLHSFEWDGRDLQGRKAPPGCYLGRLDVKQGQRKTDKLMLLR